MDLTRDIKKTMEHEGDDNNNCQWCVGMVCKDLIRWLEDLEIGVRAKIIENTALLNLVRILGRVLKTCCHSDSSERPSHNSGQKKTRKTCNNCCVLASERL